MNPLQFDLTQLIHDSMKRGDRPGPKRLYLSSHLVSSLRHVQLEFAGAPMKGETFMSLLTMQTGTLWHEYIAEQLRRKRLPVMQEVSISPYLPEGWGGTVDLVVFNEDTQRWHVVDIKTTTGEAIESLQAGGPKDAHVWQVSAYHMALSEMGFDLDPDVSLYYLPKNNVPRKEVEPFLKTFRPIDGGTVAYHMGERKSLIDAYLEEVKRLYGTLNQSYPSTEMLINELLAPPQERIQKLFRDRKTGTAELKLVPHPSTRYCPFDVELCDCSTQGQTKIGEYDQLGIYIPRRGFEHVEPEFNSEGVRMRQEEEVSVG